MQKQVQKDESNRPIEKFLTVKEFAEVLRVKPGTIYSWLSRDVGIPYIHIQGIVLFRESSIKSWLDSKEVRKKKQKYEA